MKNHNIDINLVVKAFFSIYIFIYLFPFPFDYIPFGYMFLYMQVIWLKEQWSLFIAKHLFGYNDIVSNSMNGSGDTSLDYIALVSYSIIALLMAIFLLMVLKDKNKIRKLYTFMIVYARYYVGLTLISYGVIKFLIGQFPGPSYFSLESTYGDFSPMGLAWRFFGYSDLYKGFMGAAEVLAGGLLLIRRTQVLGALIAIGVTINIFLVNLSFDVPVKLMSGHLLFFSVLILLPYINRLIDFFIFNEPAHIPAESYSFNHKWLKSTYIGIKVILIILIPSILVIGHVSSQKMRIDSHQWEGVYEVQSTNDFDNNLIPSLQKIIVDGKSIMTIDNRKEKKYYNIEHIWDEGEINFIEGEYQEDPFSIKITEQDNMEYLLTLKMDTTNIDFVTKRKLKNDYFLVKRGFNWINEYPVNR